jgi:hypothetical protein
MLILATGLLEYTCGGPDLSRMQMVKGKISFNWQKHTRTFEHGQFNSALNYSNSYNLLALFLALRPKIYWDRMIEYRNRTPIIKYAYSL